MKTDRGRDGGMVEKMRIVEKRGGGGEGRE
jgi:hypothetical protein